MQQKNSQHQKNQKSWDTRKKRGSYMFHPKKREHTFYCVFIAKNSYKNNILCNMQNGSFGIVTIIHWNVYKDKQFSLKIYTHTSHTVPSFFWCVKKLVKVIKRERKGVLWTWCHASCKFVLTNWRKSEKRSSADVITTSRKQMPFFSGFGANFAFPQTGASW